MGDSEVIRILSLFVLLTLMCAIARQMSEMTVVGYDPSEGFEARAPAPAPQIYGVPENTGAFEPEAVGTYSLRPVDTETTVDAVGSLSAQKYYEKDFAAQTTRVGNYTQRTNNYRQA